MRRTTEGNNGLPAYGQSLVQAGVRVSHTKYLASIFLLLASAFSYARPNDAFNLVMRGSDLENVLGVDASIPHYHALVIGINKYEHWQSLRRAKPDAEELADLLLTRYGFDSVTTLYDEQATRGGISLALRRLTEQLDEDDALLIFYAGHGYFDRLLNQGYWVPHEARERVDGTPATTDWFSNNELQDFASALRARHVLVVSDSCFSGSLFRGGVLDCSDKATTWYRRAIQQPSRWGMTSGDLEQVPDQSVFARKFIEALRFPLQPVFSASDVASRIKIEVAGQTGTLMQAGPLQVARGSQFGEFIFLDFATVRTPITIASVKAKAMIHPPVVAEHNLREPIQKGGPIAGRNWVSPSTDCEFVWIDALKLWVGKYEATNGEYRKMNPRHNSKSFKGYSLNGDRQPVVYVSFDDAKAYAVWLTERDKAQLGGLHYRLPSDEEFMIYAQCGDRREFPWGSNWPPRNGQAGNYCGQETRGIAGSMIDGYSDAHIVACDVENSWANPWGLYGVGGNVWEACASDATGGAFGAWRGASWVNRKQGFLSCMPGLDFVGSYRAYADGFRLVLSQ